MDEKKKIIKLLTEKRKDLSKPIIYEGYKEIFAGLQSFENDKFLIGDIKWLNDNLFFMIVNKYTQKVFAIRDFGRFRPRASDFLFTSDYIPIAVGLIFEKQDLKKRVDKALDLLQREVHNMMKNEKKPGFLLDHLGGDTYKSWSLLESKYVIVEDFKEGIGKEKLSELDDATGRNVVEAEEYVIIPPSEELIQLLGLDLVSRVWKRKYPWNSWYKQTPRSACPEISSECSYFDLYKKALKILNRDRQFDYGHAEAFYELECSIDLVEKMARKKIPVQIIEGCTGSMKRLVDELAFVTLDLGTEAKEN